VTRDSRLRPVLADAARCQAASDLAALSLLLSRRSARDLRVLFLLALECADPERLAALTLRCRDCKRPLRPREEAPGYHGARGRCPGCAAVVAREERAARRRAA